MYCCLKADLIASNLLEPGPAAAALLTAMAPVTNPGLNVGIVYVGVEAVVEVASPSYPNPRQRPTSEAFFPFPSLKRDFLNQGVCNTN